MKQAYKLQNTDGWLISFTDLLFLLITFFVLQISMSKLPNILASTTVKSSDFASEKSELQNSQPPVAVQSIIDIAANGSNVSSIFSNGKLYLNIPNVMFVKAKGQLSFAGEEFIKNLGLTLKDKNYKIFIHGLADSIESEFYLEHSKWKLTEQRTASIWRQLIDAGVEKSLISLSAGFINNGSTGEVEGLTGAQLIFSFPPEDLKAVNKGVNTELIELSQPTEQFFLDL